MCSFCKVKGLMFTKESSEIISMTTAVMNDSYLPTEAAATVVIAIFHSSCKYILDADIMLARFRGAEQTDSIPRTTILKHPPTPSSHPQHGPARRTAGGGDNTETSTSHVQPTVLRYLQSFLPCYSCVLVLHLIFVI